MKQDNGNKKEIIQENLNSISEELPKGQELYQASLVSALQQDNIRKRVDNLLDYLEIDNNVSCFDTSLITKINSKIEGYGINLTEEQENILFRINKIIELNSKNMLEQLKTVKYDFGNLDSAINLAENKTLYLLLKNSYNFNDLMYFLDQELNSELFILTHKFLLKNKERFEDVEYELLYKKLILNKFIDYDYIKGFFINSNIDYIEEKTYIIDSNILKSEDIKELFNKEENSFLWGKILESNYLDDECITILLNKVIENYTKNFHLIKYLIINNILKDNKFKIEGKTLDFLLSIYKEDEEIKPYLSELND